MKTVKVIFVLLLAAVAVVADAAPAPWYRWRSLVENMEVCAQVSPGDGWVMIKGPYQDAHCRTPGKPSNSW